MSGSRTHPKMTGEWKHRGNIVQTGAALHNTSSKIWPDPKLVHFVDHHDYVVAEDLVQGLVDHRRVAFASQGVPELPLDHREGCLDVRAPVIVGHKFFLPRVEVVEHPIPRTRDLVLGACCWT